MSILDQIVVQKRVVLAQLLPRPCALGNLLWNVKAFGEWRDFVDALRNPYYGSMNVIAEVKKTRPPPESFGPLLTPSPSPEVMRPPEPVVSRS